MLGADDIVTLGFMLGSTDGLWVGISLGNRDGNSERLGMLVGEEDWVGRDECTSDGARDGD